MTIRPILAGLALGVIVLQSGCGLCHSCRRGSTPAVVHTAPIAQPAPCSSCGVPGAIPPPPPGFVPPPVPVQGTAFSPAPAGLTRR